MPHSPGGVAYYTEPRSGGDSHPNDPESDTFPTDSTPRRLPVTGSQTWVGCSPWRAGQVSASIPGALPSTVCTNSKPADVSFFLFLLGSYLNTAPRGLGPRDLNGGAFLQ